MLENNKYFLQQYNFYGMNFMFTLMACCSGDRSDFLGKEFSQTNCRQNTISEYITLVALIKLSFVVCIQKKSSEFPEQSIQF